jgi:hypothetical protein
VLNTSPDKFRVVWKVEGLKPEEAEAFQHAMAREFGGDPAATDSTRVLRLPGFANKKYYQDFYVKARAESTEIYHHRDFKIQLDSQDAPPHHDEERAQRNRPSGAPSSQSEHDWAYAKRALNRGDDPVEIVRRIADFRAEDKPSPEYYARHTVMKAQGELQRKATSIGGASTEVTLGIESSQDRSNMP